MKMSSILECVILYRNTGNGRVGFVSEADGEMHVFATEDEAIEAASRVPVCKVFLYQIVTLDEL